MLVRRCGRGRLEPRITLLSTIKIREAGWADCGDTEVMLAGQLRLL